MTHRLRLCPDCGSRLGGVHVGRRRQVVDVPPSVAVVVTEHEVEKGWCAVCRQWHEASLDLAGVVVGQRRLGGRVAALVETYESAHIIIPPVHGVEALRYLMAENALTQAELAPIFGAPSVISEVLSGKRRLTLAHITQLAAYFGLPAEVFI